MRRPTPKQLDLLKRLKSGLGAAWNSEASIYTYMPFVDEERVFIALERNGWIAYRRCTEPTISYNGYALTEAGREQIVLADKSVGSLL